VFVWVDGGQGGFAPPQIIVIKLILSPPNTPFLLPVPIIIIHSLSRIATHENYVIFVPHIVLQSFWRRKAGCVLSAV